eukprot:960107-Pleurochrysis_carterae.AAC.3
MTDEYDTFLAVGLEPFALSRASELFSEAETSRRASLLAGLRLDAAFDDCELKATGLKKRRNPAATCCDLHAANT